MALAMSEAEVAVHLAREFPQLRGVYALDRLTKDGLVLRSRAGSDHLRGGAAVSAAEIFALAEIAFRLALLSRIGPLGCVDVASAAIDFLRPPDVGRHLVAEVRILGLGPVLVVGDVLVREDAEMQIVARANLTCALPPGRD